VSVIDIRYWWYEQDGSTYAPPGGKNMSPRQFERVIKHKASSFDAVYRAVREYREKYPDKAVVYSSDGQNPFAWAALMGGGSLATVRVPLDANLRAEIPRMQPADLLRGARGQYLLVEPSENYLVYSTGRDTIALNLPAGAQFAERWINPRSGEMSQETTAAAGQFKSPGGGMTVLWLSRK